MQRNLERMTEPARMQQRTLEQVQRNLERMTDPARIQRTLERMTDPARMQRAIEQMNRTQRNLERMTDPARMQQRMVAHLQSAVSWSRLAEATRRVVESYDLGAEAQEPFTILEEESPDADESASFAAALASLPVQAQIAILVAGLVILDKAGTVLTSFTGQDVPAPLRASIELLFAVIAFLLLWIEQQSKAADGEDPTTEKD